MKILSLVVALAALSFAAPSGAAAVAPSAKRAVVSTAGLDLTRAKDQRVLDLRILHAASSLCGTPSPANPLGWKAFKQCRDKAMAGAQAQRQVVVESTKRRPVDTLASAK